ncbi:hypothetical protein TPHA_0A03500 [Tetrapisispora phaffii CBS 4417]|uniref:NOT2/NOT3/NOT5 C-terminal domain-containing protein n=1 Tax=Tetrapisispora phaffii (strain ATCC 24235 / CBS 4417 / NBRC 1672 / NRRL Y-8282 / UCD 70-5) TaxID=1071381 RepID=G8BNE9_TETPH|nr:hypothetical protein TPHA_0A03500 [Tetrapisispora phaffii CBS 4417]CCE61427.1 hypothetical protein TPHA_0A03500 [Tetrapisispora phaffii CBS 4417]
MSQRKLQQEVDKLLKKVKEGLEEYDLIHDKFQASDPDNTSYREKLESDLKREIKKLQKHRDQIKTWLSKEDIKDKVQQLTESRRLIEIDMEKFKTIEKLMKTKQFSTEALSNPDKFDINNFNKEIVETEEFQFIKTCIEELQLQLEKNEMIKNDENIDSTECENKISRLEFHILNLENLLKLLTNEEITKETINDFKEDIKYYVENNEDPDFIEYDTIYEDMGCEVKKETMEEVNNDGNLESTNTASSSVTNTPSKLKNVDRNAFPKKSKSSTTLLNDNISNDSTTKLVKKKETTLESNKNKEDSDKVSNIKFPEDMTQKIDEIIAADMANYEAFNNPLFKDELKYLLNAKRKLMQPYAKMPDTMIQQLESSLLNCPDSLDADTPIYYKKPLSLPHPTSVFFPNEPIRFVCPMDVQPQQRLSAENTENSNKINENNADEDNIEVNDIYSRTSLAKIFRKFDLDTLFFIFYHYQGTYEQFLVARELSKCRNWKYNKVDRNWYFKEVTKSAPDMAQTEEETWRYFDYQNSWLARRCNHDFQYREEEFEKL